MTESNKKIMKPGEVALGDFYDAFPVSNSSISKSMDEWKEEAERVLEAVAMYMAIPMSYLTGKSEPSWEDRQADLMRRYGQTKVKFSHYGRAPVSDVHHDRDLEAKYRGYSTWSDLRAAQPKDDQIHRQGLYGNTNMDAGFVWVPYVPIQITSMGPPVRTDEQRNAEAVYHGFADWADMQKSTGIGADK